MGHDARNDLYICSITDVTQCRSACTVQQARVSEAKNLYDYQRDPSLSLRDTRKIGNRVTSVNKNKKSGSSASGFYF